MEFDKVIRERCAIRRFTNEQVEKEKLDKILEAGNLAPTAKNNQPQRIYVVQSEEGLNKIDEISKCRYHAPTVLIICINLDEVYQGEHGNTADIDASIVATHMMLEATNQGVDNIWIDLFDHIKIKEVFNLPDNIKPVALMPLGYRDNIGPSPLHNKRKDLEEIVIYI